MDISEVIEKTVGNRMAVKLVLCLPLLPKNLFLGAKFRYFNRYNLDEEAAAYIRALAKNPRVSVALKLHQIMSALGPILSNDRGTLANLDLLRVQLKEWRPATSKQAYRKLRSLIKCFEFDSARTGLVEYRDLLQDTQREELQSYFSATEEILDYFSPLIDAAWKNSLSYEAAGSPGCAHNTITFYFPPALCKLEMGMKSSSSFYMHTSTFFRNLHASIPKELYKVEDKLQFSWRTIKEPLGENQVVSYHTRGEGRRNIRIKESALANYFTMDSTGFSGWHSVADLQQDSLDAYLKNTSNDEIEATYSALYKELVENNVSKYAQPQGDSDPVGEGEDFYFLALQLANDVVAELAYIDTYNLLKSATDISLKHDVKLVIKRHPKCTSVKIKELLHKLEKRRNITISGASIHSIIPACKAVITVNSGVGMEALLHLKDVICTGKAEYSPIARTARSRGELEHNILHYSATDPLRIKQFLHYYATEHLYHYDDKSKLEQFWLRNFRSLQGSGA